jgi:heterodisulfide reductase subunit B
VKYAFYPGCSLEASSAAYAQSMEAVCRVLGIDLVEVDDWNCCGATEYHSLHRLAAAAVIARNLALVDPQLDQLVAPCAACFLNLKKVDHQMAEDPMWATKVNAALAAGGLSYTPGRVKVRHLVEVLHSDIGEEKIRSHVKFPLKGLRVAPYYGCQIVRPYKDVDNTEYPLKLDELMSWVGADVIPYPMKAACCGGHLTQISEDQAYELLRRLLQNAADAGADVILCMCPMCQLNLDAYQSAVNSRFGTRFQMPILFFTQALGLAFGLPMKKLGFGKEIVSALPVLQRKIPAVVASAASG